MEDQQALAERAGVHLSTVSRIERGVPSGRRSPSWPKIEAALKWPASHISRLADGERAHRPDIYPVPHAVADEIEQAVLAAVSDAEPDVTVRRAHAMAEGAIAELRRRGLLPPEHPEHTLTPRLSGKFII